MSRYIVPIALILAAALSRLIPHPPNFAPITALALFGGVYLEKKYSFIIPLAAMLLSDAALGFYSGMHWVYASFLAIGGIGVWLGLHRGVAQTIGATFAGSLLFFVVTNFGVWFMSEVTYPHTLAGLADCYIAAIPFFRNTLIGDTFYVGVMFGAFELMRKMIPALTTQPPLSRS